MKILYFFNLLVFVSLVAVAQNKVDKLESLRTSKKIISVNASTEKPKYSVQILALKLPPGNASFFNNIDVAYEFDCTDDYVRYCVGDYNSYAEAVKNVQKYKDLGYNDAFAINTSRYNLESGVGNNNFVPDPNKRYTIQVGAFRFPVYLSHFKGLDGIKEFYFKNKIYKYTYGDYSYEEAIEKLKEIKQMSGLEKAFVTELDAYLPYQIE